MEKCWCWVTKVFGGSQQIARINTSSLFSLCVHCLQDQVCQSQGRQGSFSSSPYSPFSFMGIKDVLWAAHKLGRGRKVEHLVNLSCHLVVCLDTTTRPVDVMQISASLFPCFLVHQYTIHCFALPVLSGWFIRL